MPEQKGMSGWRKTSSILLVSFAKVKRDSTNRTMTKAEEIEAWDRLLQLEAALKALVNGMPEEAIDTHVRNLLDRAQEVLSETNKNK